MWGRCDLAEIRTCAPEHAEHLLKQLSYALVGYKRYIFCRTYNVLSLNGHGIYATWTVIASLINLSIALRYVGDVPMITCARLSLSILLVILVIWFALENTILDSRVRLILTPYLGKFRQWKLNYLLYVMFVSLLRFSSCDLGQSWSNERPGWEQARDSGWDQGVCPWDFGRCLRIFRPESGSGHDQADEKTPAKRLSFQLYCNSIEHTLIHVNPMLSKETLIICNNSSINPREQDWPRKSPPKTKPCTAPYQGHRILIVSIEEIMLVVACK